MKTLRTLFVAMMALCTVALTGCTKDDDATTAEGSHTATGMANMQISETSNTIVASWTEAAGPISIDMKWTFYFGADGLCTSCKQESTFPTADMAQATYREAMASPEPDVDYAVNGKTYIQTVSIYNEYTKADIRTILEGMKTGNYNGGNGGNNNGGNGGNNNGGNDNGGNNGGNDNGGDDDDLISYDDPNGLMPAGTTIWTAENGDETGLLYISLSLTKVDGNKYTFSLGLTVIDEETSEEHSDAYTGTVYFSPYTGSGTVIVSFANGRINTSTAHLTININTPNEIEVSYQVGTIYGATLTRAQ